MHHIRKFKNVSLSVVVADFEGCTEEKRPSLIKIYCNVVTVSHDYLRCDN
jgi:hypothetical protein